MMKAVIVFFTLMAVACAGTVGHYGGYPLVGAGHGYGHLRYPGYGLAYGGYGYGLGHGLGYGLGYGLGHGLGYGLHGHNLGYGIYGHGKLY